MSDYPTLLDGMMGASLTTTTPEWVMRGIIAPPVPCRGLEARKAPLGLRRIEAALLEGGFSRDEVAIVPPEKLARAVGPGTKAVLVSSGDPLGRGMNTGTMTGLGGGAAFTPRWFAKMMKTLRILKDRFSFKVIVGGAGAWQLAHNDGSGRELGIDTVFCGYGENEVAALAKRLCSGDEAPRIYRAAPGPLEDAPAPRGPTTMGVVEISRGCGLGCPFCTLAKEPITHFSVEEIVRDVQTNVEGGQTSVVLASEDFLRYGADGASLNPGRLLDMAEAVRAVKGLRLIQLDHVNVTSIARFPAKELRELHGVLTRGVTHDCLWLNLGVESASGELLVHNACRGKLHPYDAGEWEGVCEDALGKLLDAGFMPMVSLLFGLPGSTEEDIGRTYDFMKRFEGKRLTAFPLFYAPVSLGEKAFTVGDMTPLHWKLLKFCYSFNFKWLPRMYWDNHRGAGAGCARKLFVQLGGMAKRLELRLRFLRASGKVFA